MTWYLVKHRDKVTFTPMSSEFCILEVIQTHHAVLICVGRVTCIANFIFRIIHLTARNRALLEKLIVAQLIKKFPAFYGPLRFITVFTTARCLTLT
jgi:NAD-dependent DNA ligase